MKNRDDTHPRAGLTKALVYFTMAFNIILPCWFVYGCAASTKLVKLATMTSEQIESAMGAGGDAMFAFIIWTIGNPVLFLALFLIRPKPKSAPPQGPF